MKQEPQHTPLAVQVGLALTLFNSWVLFAETVIDRLGWWQYMPCYRVGRFCEWDVAAIAVVLAIWLAAFPATRFRVVASLRRGCGVLGCRSCRAA